MSDNNNDFLTKVTDLLEALRVHLQNDGGDLELDRIEGKTVYLRLRGACGCCPHAQAALKQGIEQILKEQIDPEIIVERVE